VSVVYMIADADGDGTAGAPRDVARWHGPRVDVLSRVFRASLGCLDPSGNPNPVVEDVRFSLYADCSPAFCVAAADFPDEWIAQVHAVSFLDSEDRPLPPLRAGDPVGLKELCRQYALTMVRLVNGAGLGFAIGAQHPIQDIASAMAGFSFTKVTALSAALRTRYVARLGGGIAREPTALTSAGKWNVPAMVAYADALDALPNTAPENLIHYLYELAGAITLAASPAF
jgi:hypothetical protein